MAIAPIQTIDDNSAQGSTSGNDVIDKNEFLLLLVTQLQNQDPLNPMDYSEFTSQTAQFASLEQLQRINENLGYLKMYQSALFDENAVAFIGKEVKVSDSRLSVTEGVCDELQFELKTDATQINAYIYNSNGDLIKSITQTGTFNAGEQVLSWDGTDDNGNPVDDGTYFYEVQAVDVNGATFSGDPFYVNTITSVNLWDGTAYLTAGDRDIPIGNVVKVSGI